MGAPPPGGGRSVNSEGSNPLLHRFLKIRRTLPQKLHISLITHNIYYLKHTDKVRNKHHRENLVVKPRLNGLEASYTPDKQHTASKGMFWV